MAAKLEIDLHPKTPLTDATRAKQRLFARLIYTREVADNPPRSSLLVPATTTVELDTDGKATFRIEDGAPKSKATLQIETAQGALLAQQATEFPADGKAATSTFKVPEGTYRKADVRTKPEVSDLMDRTGRNWRPLLSLHGSGVTEGGS